MSASTGSATCTSTTPAEASTRWTQVRRHHELLRGGVVRQPAFATTPPHWRPSSLVDDARAAVMTFFNADPSEYGVIFTPNASGALKLVGESYPFQPGGRFLLTYDNHNSVNGIREFARHHGADVNYLPVLTPELRVDGETVSEALRERASGVPRLFAYPAQSNFSGVQHPLDLGGMGP